MSFFKKQTVFGWLLLSSAVLALVSLIVYLVNSTTGYLDGAPVNVAPILLTVFALAGIVVVNIFASKIGDRFTGLALLAIVVMLSLSVCLYIVSKIEVLEAWFIPVNHPPAMYTACDQCVVGVVFYVVTIALVIASSFGLKHKES